MPKKLTIVSAAALAVLAAVVTIMLTGVKREEFPEQVSVFFEKRGEIVLMSGEEFLEGCVRGLIPRGEIPPREALRAVSAAVKCRALYVLENGDRSGTFGADFSVGEFFPYAEETENDISAEISSALKSAPELRHGGEVFEAMYCRVSSGATDACETSPSVALPGDMGAAGYESVTAFSSDEVRRSLGVSVTPSNPAEWFGEAVRAESGTLLTAEFCGRTFGGEELRSRLGLRSSAVTWEFRDDGFYFTCRGYGCNKGLSVNAAIKLAREGNSAEEILNLFYP